MTGTRSRAPLDRRDPGMAGESVGGGSSSGWSFRVTCLPSRVSSACSFRDSLPPHFAGDRGSCAWRLCPNRLGWSVTPDGSALYFFKKVDEGQDYQIFSSMRTPEGWTAPGLLDLGGEFSDLYASIFQRRTSQGVEFVPTRAREGGGWRTDVDVARRLARPGWHLGVGAGIHSDGYDVFPFFSPDGRDL